MDKERTTREGQVTYPVFTGRPGYLPALAHLTMHVAFLSLSFIYEVQLSTTCLAVFTHLLVIQTHQAGDKAAPSLSLIISFTIYRT